MKVADVGKSLTKMMPEYVDCKKIAKKTGRPVGIVMQQALEAFRKQT
jgi:hypothetical protein